MGNGDYLLCEEVWRGTEERHLEGAKGSSTGDMDTCGWLLVLCYRLRLRLADKVLEYFMGYGLAGSFFLNLVR